MTRMRLADDEPAAGSVILGLALGALAGFVAGVVVAQKAGGIPGVMRRVRMGLDALEDSVAHDDTFADAEDHEYGDDELEEGADEDDAMDATLEEQVLDAFEEDDVLSERAIDIGAVGQGVIELGGTVRSAEEAGRAVGLARGVEGVASVVNRLAIAPARTTGTKP